MHRAIRQAVTLTWLLLNSQSTVDLIANPKMLLNTRKVQGEDAICVHCNSGVKIVYRVGDLPGYGNVWYKPKGIANIILMLRATKKFWVIFNIEGGNCFWMVLTDREVRFHLSPNRLYYFDAAGRENIILLLKMVL